MKFYFISIFLLFVCTKRSFGQSGLTGTPTTLALGGAVTGPTTLDFTTSGTANFAIQKATANYFSILNGGNIGIGTTTPASKFHVELANTNYTNTAGAGSHVVMSNSSAAGQNVISSIINGITVAKWRSDYQGNISWVAGGGVHDFYTNGDFPTGTSKMRITNNGTVGIGTTSPLTTLHVKGFGSFGENVTTANAIRTLNISDPSAVVRVLRVHPTSAPAVELISRTTADGANVAYWDFYAQPSDASFRIRDRTAGGSGFDRITILNTSGYVGIGTINPHEMLSVNGNILARKVKVSVLASDWSDYVFDKTYTLQSLPEVEKFINENKHLPNIPSAFDIAKEGLDLGQNQALLLQKIEELTLYLIQQNKKIDEQSLKLLELTEKMKSIKGK